MYTFWQDIRFGTRMLRKHPVFTAIAVLSMALGIGANTTMYSIVDAVLFSPLPVENPERLVSVYTKTPKDGNQQFFYPDFEYIRENNEAFTDVTTFAYTAVGMQGSDRAEFLIGEMVEGNYFSMLGVNAALGRTILPEETRVFGSCPIVVLSHHRWERSFDSDPGIVGKTLKLSGHAFEVIGVMGKEFNGLVRGFSSDFWVPLAMHSAVGVEDEDALNKRKFRQLCVFGRLKDDVSMKKAAALLSVQAEQLAQAFPKTNEGIGFSLFPASEFLLAPHFRRHLVTFMTILMILSALVLLIACANVANLLLARYSSRRREITIRVALGAGRWRLVRQLLTESILLSFLGAALGLYLTAWAGDLLLGLVPSFVVPVTLELGVNTRVLGYTVIVAVLTGIVFGLTPAMRAANTDIVSVLKEDSARGGYRRSRLRNTLVIAQVAMSLALLVAAGLFGRSLISAQTAETGLEMDNRLTAQIATGLMKYSDEQEKQFFRDLDERLAGTPGVQSYARVDRIPLGMSHGGRNIDIDGHEAPAEKPHNVESVTVTPDYFRAMGIQLVRGRVLTSQDGPETHRVVVVNERMVELYWPGQNPVGRTFRVLPYDGSEPETVEIVGVVKTTKHRSLGESPLAMMYLADAQESGTAHIIVVHTQGNPHTFTPVLRSVVRQAGPDMPLLDVKTMHERVKFILLPQRVGAIILGVMGAAALLLAGIGLYGVMSYSVGQRTHEIGIRMALGARARDVVRLVVGQGMRLAGIGLLVGLVASLLLSRFLAYLLYGVSSMDPVTFVAVALFLSSVAFTACFLPARRASRVHPMTALHYE